MKPDKLPKTLVIGHQNPDTDSIVSALVYAQLRNQIDGKDRYEGVALGPLNTQSVWLLKQGNTKPPRQVTSIELRVRDLANSTCPTVQNDDPLGKALNHIARDGISTIPVLSETGKLEGILSDRIPECNYFHHFNTEEFLGILFTLDDLVKTFGLDVWQEGAGESTGKLTLDPNTIGNGDILLSGVSQPAIAAAKRAGAAAVIVCTPTPKQDWEETLRATPSVGVYRFTGSLMALTSQLSHCIPAENAMTSRYAFLHPDQPINDVRSQILSSAYPLPVTDNDGLFLGLISRAELLKGKKQKIILVDHFESQQAVNGLADAEIVEIVDHHRVGNLETQLPISVDCRPVGSTATIIAQRFKEHALRPSPTQASLLLGAIISDTLALTSPTTTENDRKSANELATIASLDLGRFSMQVLVQADTTLTASAETLVNQDLKEFGINKIRFSVSQIETVDRNKLTEDRISELREALATTRRERALTLSCLLITDVLQQNSLILIDDADQHRLSELGGGMGAKAPIWEGCVSRKKQFLPKLLEKLSELTP